MKLMTLSLLCALSLTACAQSAGPDANAGGGFASVKTDKPDPAAEKRVRDAILRLAPKTNIDRIAPSALSGFQEVIADGHTIYISNDGRYLLEGELFDVASHSNISQMGMSVVRREGLAKVPVSDRIVFAPVGPAKYTVSVFTDIECGYCRKLHSQIGEYNKLGIAVQYLAFPRAGLGTPDSVAMESVWCSEDRRKALTDAKNGLAVPPKACKNPVADEYHLGLRLGLTGTPMIVNADGVMLPGYLPPDKMLEALDKLAAQAKAGKPTPDTAAGAEAKADKATGTM